VGTDQKIKKDQKRSKKIAKDQKDQKRSQKIKGSKLMFLVSKYANKKNACEFKALGAKGNIHT